MNRLFVAHRASISIETAFSPSQPRQGIAVRVRAEINSVRIVNSSERT
ncbi:MAG: hypothetical protein LBK58_01150 [Prevotellaceae bacterium]|nr:hypothetical protein [Prevotellaceae bacterium]